MVVGDRWVGFIVVITFTYIWDPAGVQIITTVQSCHPLPFWSCLFSKPPGDPWPSPWCSSKSCPTPRESNAMSRWTWSPCLCAAHPLIHWTNIPCVSTLRHGAGALGTMWRKIDTVSRCQVFSPSSLLLQAHADLPKPPTWYSIWPQPPA